MIVDKAITISIFFQFRAATLFAVTVSFFEMSLEQHLSSLTQQQLLEDLAIIYLLCCLPQTNIYCHSNNESCQTNKATTNFFTVLPQANSALSFYSAGKSRPNYYTHTTLNSSLQTLVHELGHNLGMHHPFNRKGQPKYSKESGEICTGKSVGGFMDYIPDQFRRKWSACSVEDFKTYYQLYILRKGCFCLETCEPRPTPKPTTPKPQRPKPSICKRLCKKGRYVNLKFCQRVCGVE